MPLSVLPFNKKAVTLISHAIFFIFYRQAEQPETKKNFLVSVPLVVLISLHKEVLKDISNIKYQTEDQAQASTVSYTSITLVLRLLHLCGVFS